MIEKGIKVVQTFENDGPATSRVAIKKTVRYKDMDKEWAARLWNKYGGLLGGGSFTDSAWVAASKFGDLNNHIDWTMAGRWEDPLKLYTLLLLDKGMEPFTTVARVCDVINFIRDTGGFSDECFPDFDDDPIRYCNSSGLRSDLLMVCEFVDISPDRYLDRIKALRYDDQARTIPAFNSIYKFDALINTFKADVKPGDPFMVIVLWWELTKVIPIRPIEFFTLRRDSFFIKDGRCYIAVDRAKIRKEKEHDIPVLDKIGISRDIYDLFQKYIEATREYLPEPDSFLFNVEMFQGNDMATQTEREGYIGSSFLYHLFLEFFRIVVDGKYGYDVVNKGRDEILGDNEIERFQYGDSRHVAFLNLLLSGFSPYTIAQIGGHTTIRQQMHYYDHLESYLTSKAYTMTRKARMNLDDALDAFNLRGKYALSAAVTCGNTELETMRPLSIGWCSSENFPYECEYDDCLTCPYSIIDKEHQHMIPEKMKSCRDDIHNHADFVRRMIQDPSLGSDADRMTAINSMTCDAATIAALANKQIKEV